MRKSLVKAWFTRPQLPVEKSVTLVFSIVIEQCRCAPSQQRRSTIRE